MRKLELMTARLMTPQEMKQRLLVAMRSGELDRRYEEARAESDKLRAELDASRQPIDPVLLRTPMTI